MLRAKFRFAAVARLAIDRFNAAVPMADAIPFHTGNRLVAAAGENVAAAFPHHPRPEPRIMELVNQRCDYLAVLGFACAEQRASNRLAQQEVLDALRGPVGGNLVTGNAPDF